MRRFCAVYYIAVFIVEVSLLLAGLLMAGMVIRTAGPGEPSSGHGEIGPGIVREARLVSAFFQPVSTFES